MKTLFPHVRFERKIEQHGSRGCWIWKGAVNGEGYGRMMVGSRRDGSRHQESVHRFAYRFYNGPIPAGMNVYQKCGVKQCANPSHLKVGTQSDIIRLAVKRRTWTQGAHLLAYASKPGELNGNAKLNAEQVIRIAVSLDNGGQQKNEAKLAGVSVGNISAIKTGKIWKSILSEAKRGCGNVEND